MAGTGQHIPDSDRRGPDYDHPQPSLQHLAEASLADKYGAPPEPIVSTPASTANYTLTRLGYKVAGVIIHTTVGSEASAVSAFQSPTRQASAQYVIACDGSHIDQCVSEADIAWHCGRFYTDAADPLANCNTIGIEHCDNGNYDSPRPDGLYQTSSDLVKDICTRYGIPIDRTHIRKHREVSQLATSCPDSLDIDRIVAMANGTYGPVPGTLTGGTDDMIYTGPIHAMNASFKVFDTGEASYPDPVAVAAVGHPLATGVAVSVDAYCYSSSPVQSADLGGGVAGPDYLYWRSSGRWIPDAHMDTTTLATAPKPGIPAGEVLSIYGAGSPGKDGAPGKDGTNGTDGKDGKDGKDGAPGASGLNKDQVDAEILVALGNFKPPAAPPAPHHHGVLGIINTGPAIADVAAKK